MYQVDYSYNKSCNCYTRSLAGDPHRDNESGKQLSPKNVVVLNVDYTIDPDGRYQYDLVGTGRAHIFMDGNVIKASWKKTSRSAMLKLYDKSGDEIGINPGQTWYTALDVGQTVEYSK